MPRYTKVDDLPEQHRAEATRQLEGGRVHKHVPEHAVVVTPVPEPKKRTGKINYRKTWVWPNDESMPDDVAEAWIRGEVGVIHSPYATKPELLASNDEAEDYSYLLTLNHFGIISDLTRDPRLLCHELLPSFTDNQGKKHRAITYTPDFRFILNGRLCFFDTKGPRTREFGRTEKLFRYHYPDYLYGVGRVQSWVERILKSTTP